MTDQKIWNFHQNDEKVASWLLNRGSHLTKVQFTGRLSSKVKLKNVTNSQLEHRKER